jgi:DNA-binding transcriptional ArsR family regulator
MRFEYAKYFMRKAYQFIKKNPVSLTSTGIARNEISIVSKKLLSIPWKGQLGTSELAALKAHLQAAYRAGSFTYGLSIREQELTSECAIMTCRKANDRLIKKGWLTRHKRDTHEDSTIWTISPESLYSTHTYLEGAGECAKPETVAPKGIFRTFLIKDERGLGKSAGRIYAQIALGRSDINEIVKATGLARATVYRALKRLKSAGIVDQDNSLTGQIPENLVRSADRKESAIRSRQARERDAWQLNKEEYEISKLRKAA